MGMGYAANNVLALNEEKLRNEFKQAFKALDAALESAGVDFKDLAAAAQYDMPLSDECEDITDAQEADVHNALDALTEEFKNTYDLTLYLEYHDSEGEGDRYDDIDGVVFTINHSEAYTITPKAKVLNDEIGFEDKFFVTYG